MCKKCAGEKQFRQSLLLVFTVLSNEKGSVSYFYASPAQTVTHLHILHGFNEEEVKFLFVKKKFHFASDVQCYM